MRNSHGYYIAAFDKIPPYGFNTKGTNNQPKPDMLAARTLSPGEYIDVRDKERARAIVGNLRLKGWNVQVRGCCVYRVA